MLREEEKFLSEKDRLMHCSGSGLISASLSIVSEATQTHDSIGYNFVTEKSLITLAISFFCLQQES